MAHIFRRTDNRGQAMVEMAFVLMILFVLVYGITEFGRAMYTKNMLNNTARAAVRTAVVTQNLPVSGITYTAGTFGTATAKTNCDTIDTSTGTAELMIEKSICQGLIYVLKYNLVTASVSVTQATANVGNCGSPCIARTNDSVTVSVTDGGFSSLLPGLFGPSGYIPFFPSSLTGTATMRYE